MNALEAAAVVLDEAAEPLHYREITRRMLALKLWTTAGKTPWDTVNARMAVEIKERGSASRFLRVRRGWFALNRNATEGPPQADRAQQELDEVVPSRVMSFTDAAERVLSQSGNREPLHYREITERALALGLIRTEGRTPAASMYAQIGTENRRLEGRGDRPRFMQHGRGMVGLTAWTPVGVVRLIQEQNREARQALLDRARNLAPDGFEDLVAELLAAMGFEDVEVTSSSGDGGIDVRGTLVVGDAVRTRMAVQAKRWKHNVQAPVVQQVRGSLGAHEQGLIITTSDFSRGARDEAVRPDAAPVALINGERFAALLAEHEIGSRNEPHNLVMLDAIEEGLDDG